MKKGSITVFSALVFMMIASFLFALLESARTVHLEAYADMSTELAIESVCAEYQPGLWQNYHLLCLDGAYGGEGFSMDYVTAVLGERIRMNLDQDGDGNRIMGMELATAYPTEYQLLADGAGSVFLNCVSEYMKENLPMEAAQILYDRYTQEETVKNSQQTEGSVECAQTAIDQAKREQQEKLRQQREGQSQGKEAQPQGKAVQSQAGEPALDGDSQAEGKPAEVEENPLELVLALKQKALLGLVVTDLEAVSTKKIDLTEAVGGRNLEKGTLQPMEKLEWYDKVLVLEYLDEYFSDYQTMESDHVISYEVEYVLSGKETDQGNLEGTVERLLLVREAANVTHILGDSGMRNEALLLAETLAGFTGNPAIIKVVQIGIVAAWAYVESILDVRALLLGDKIALLKSAEQWTSRLGSLGRVLVEDVRTKNCTNGFSYQDYLKGFLFMLDAEELAYRMMDVMEQNIRLVPAYRNCRMDHMLCRIDYEAVYTAEPLFSKLSVLGKPEFSYFQLKNNKSFSY